MRTNLIWRDWRVGYAFSTYYGPMRWDAKWQRTYSTYYRYHTFQIGPLYLQWSVQANKK